MYEDLLLAIIVILLGALGYFLKRILDSTDAISKDVADIKPKVKILWEMEFAESRSPLTLNERGREILQESGIKEMVDEEFSMLMEQMKGKQPQNAYQVQEMAKEVLDEFKHDLVKVDKLQQGAFNTGADVDSVLFVGSLYLRDLALPQFRFSLDDVDRHKQ